MKKDIHPEYKPAKITCVCGNVIETRSTKGDYEIQICSKCHPFFTGKQKFVDTAGRVERFQRRYGNFTAKKAAGKAKAEKPTGPAPTEEPQADAPPESAAEAAPATPAAEPQAAAENTET